MVSVSAYAHGIYPRSEAVVAATRDLDRGRTTVEAVEARFRDDLEQLVADQREAGLDLHSDGLLGWQDLFRPLVEAAEGLRATHLQRWFDNNTFFRTPTVEGSPRLTGAPSLLARDEVVPEPRVATLPSPYLFSRAAAADGDRDALMGELARGVLRPAAEELAARGCALLHLEEPWLTFHGIEAGSWPAFEEAVAAITDGLDLPVVVHAPLGDVAPHAERLGDLPVHAVGIDAIATDLEALDGGWSTGLVVGCVDGRNTPLEPVEETAKAVARLAERLEPPDLYVSTNTELELLPPGAARRKLARLGEIAAQLEEVLA